MSTKTTYIDMSRVAYIDIRLIEEFENDMETWLLKLYFRKELRNVVKKQYILRLIMKYKPLTTFISFNNRVCEKYVEVMIAFNANAIVSNKIINDITKYFRKLNFELI